VPVCLEISEVSTNNIFANLIIQLKNLQASILNLTHTTISILPLSTIRLSFLRDTPIHRNTSCYSQYCIFSSPDFDGN